MIRMKDIILVEKPNDFFRISWKMTNWCNYRCDYCYMSSQVRAAQKQDSLEFLKSISSRIDKVIDKCAKGRPTRIHLIGGEVGYYDLIAVLDEIKSPLLRTVIIPTNFSNSIDYWQRIKDYCKDRGMKCEIIASFHLGQCNHEEFIQKAILLRAHVKCVLNPENISIYRPYFDILEENDIKIEVTIERNEENKCRQDFTKEEWDYINHLNDRLRNWQLYYIVHTADGKQHEYASNIAFINDIDIGGFNPEGFLCSGGEDNIRIDQKGRLLRGGCRHSYIHPIGSIFDDETIKKLPLEPWRCVTREADDKGVVKTKFCTAFSNATIWREELS